MNPLLAAALLLGGSAGLGTALVVAQLVPAQPDLSAALERLTTQRPEPAQASPAGLQDRLGHALLARAGGLPGVRPPTRELAILGVQPHEWLGEKALLGVIGLAFPPCLASVLAMLGIGLPWTVPTLVSVALGGFFFALPSLTVRERAAAARDDFARAVGAYVELVALERLAGSGTTQALENASHVGQSWVFERIREELLRSRLSGTTPWESLSRLGGELGVPELGDLSHIMRLAGEEGAQVYEALRARGRSLRTAMLTREQARANAVSERMVMPVALLALCFALMIATPAMYHLLVT
jgi:Type II secretion system (T2SS), protein F